MIDPAVIAINDSDLSAATRANAFALLALVHPDNGHIRLEWSELAEVFRVNSRGAARRHLTRMVEAGLIHYSTNSYVYVTFEALAARPRADLARGRAETARGRAGDGEPEDEGAARGRADSARGRADSARGRADSARSLTRAQLVGCLVDPLSNDLQEDQPNNHEPQPTTAPDADDQARTVALLTDTALGVSGKRARAIAAKHGFDYCLRVVAAFFDQLQAGSIRTGKIITAIEAEWGASDLSATFRATDFYRRHCDDDRNGEAERRRTYIPAEYADIILG